MGKTNRTPVRRFLLLSAAAGFLIAFGYHPLSDIIGKFLTEKAGLGSWTELVTVLLLGIACIGTVIYVLITISISVFASNLRNYLVKDLNKKQLLPSGFRVKLRGGYTHIYSDIIKIFDTFVSVFQTVKQDRDGFARTVGAYLDPALKRELEGRGANEIYLGGKKKKVTMFFSDLRGFTKMTETYDPKVVVQVLNDYLSMATRTVEKNNGTVNKYIGDAVMAVFEEPPKYRDYNDADKAVIAALDIQAQFKSLLAKWKRELDTDLHVGLGIGIARGEVIAGNIGSEQRMEYTVIGDTVNFASRLCGKACDGQVIIPEDVRKLLENVLVTEALPPVEIKGKTGSYEIFNVTTRKMIV